ncbi:AMP-binding protein [Chryseobacterium salivictor]|uniref:2-succinylbenzoate--CoA ligase n=1 Tax=Chryseobacterium salivictor TaxID=2547600 RepID=A0A4P6ZES9_9FLAO|nr:AMP-binding protein [Chryseobacterium salivictor]QBO57979.1 2-succinylbenzoate--CoA ligase [Chryseobacterium salivictor]
MNIDFSTDTTPSPATDFDQRVISFIKDWLDESATVKVQTSGSTGTPKIFEIEKERMWHSAKMTCDILDLKTGDSALLCLPVEYISGKMMVVRAVERKLNLIIKAPSINPISDLNEEIDFCAMSPLQVENSLEKLHFIKNLIIGGAAVSETLKDKIRQSLKSNISKSKVYETYGMSETLSHIALKEINPNTEDYFIVLDDIEISLDQRGCLQIFAPQLNPEILITNDLVDIKNGKEFKFLGRIDNVINSAGLKIYPEQLESLVKKEMDNELVFMGIADELLGQKSVLIIEGQENPEVIQRLKKIEFPSKNHRPKETIFIEIFPRIPNGKIDRRELTEMVSNVLKK